MMLKQDNKAKLTFERSCFFKKRLKIENTQSEYENFISLKEKNKKLEDTVIRS